MGNGTTTIHIEVSDNDEGTSYPWWVIVRPACTTRTDDVVNSIDGPFFSRKEAQVELDTRRHYYGKRAVVWCMSGCYSGQYKRAIAALDR